MRFTRPEIRVANRAVRRWYYQPRQRLQVCILFASGEKWTSTDCPSSYYSISEPSDPENFLQSGYRFEEPSNAYAVVSEGADPKSALASWVIAKMPNYWEQPCSLPGQQHQSWIHRSSRRVQFFNFLKPIKIVFEGWNELASMDNRFVVLLPLNASG